MRISYKAVASILCGPQKENTFTRKANPDGLSMLGKVRIDLWLKLTYDFKDLTIWHLAGDKILILTVGVFIDVVISFFLVLKCQVFFLLQPEQVYGRCHSNAKHYLRSLSMRSVKTRSWAGHLVRSHASFIFFQLHSAQLKMQKISLWL